MWILYCLVLLNSVIFNLLSFHLVQKANSLILFYVLCTLIYHTFVNCPLIIHTNLGIRLHQIPIQASEKVAANVNIET